jgi:arsenical pump membrane protein
VLVAGLLLVGHAAAEDGLFAAAGARLSRVPGAPVELYALLLGLVVCVTAILNLDTSAWFLTPVLVHAARARRIDERAFLYGTIFMSNSASLILPGANLTNLIVLSREHVTGTTFASRIWPAWIAAILVTALVVGLMFGLRRYGEPTREQPPWQIGIGAAGVIGAAVLVLALPNPAVPVLALGIVLVVLRRSSWRDVVRTTSPHVLATLFAIAVALGTLARTWAWPGDVANDHGRWAAAGVAAVGSVLVNNLPASVLLSARVPIHPRSLLVGLDLGPNLFVTGSLSVFLWYRAARFVDARPSVWTYARVGIVVAPLSIVAALAALRLGAQPWF